MKAEWQERTLTADEPGAETPAPRFARLVVREPASANNSAAAETEVVRPAEAGMRMLAEQVPVLLWATDRHLRVTWGLRHPSFVGLDARLAQLLASGDGEAAAVAAHRRALKGEAAEFDQAWEDRALHARVEPLHSPAGDVVGTVALAVEMDDTARQRREEMLRAGRYDPLTELPNLSLIHI